MVYDRLLLTSSSFVDVVLVFIVIINTYCCGMVWLGLAWHKVFVVAHIYAP